MKRIKQALFTVLILLVLLSMNACSGDSGSGGGSKTGSLTGSGK
jgi:hypothetical protein